ncbi:YbaK/EbsC family protein [Thermopolyspora sp. NPDC052614]|uniref:aminoacyl-tRNA deacylase n=1 Tax=Thermopolyspora sp. NPDC052614 TaxID=3155682 RepID=UPI00344070AB
MKDALAIHRWLLAHQVHHEILRLPRSLSGAEDLPETLGVPPETCVSVAVFAAVYAFGTERVTEHAAVVSAVAHPVTPGMVASVLGAVEVRPAPAFAVNAVTDYAAGLVCPLLLPEELTVLVDQRLFDGLKADDAVYTPTGERATALRLSARDLLAMTAGKPAELRRGPLSGSLPGFRRRS